MGLVNAIENFYMADKRKCFDHGLVRFDEDETIVFDPPKAVNIQNAKAYKEHFLSLSMTGKSLIAFVTVTTKNVWIYNLQQQIKIPLANIAKVELEKKLFLQSVKVEEKDGKSCLFSFGSVGGLKQLNRTMIDVILKLIREE